MSLIAYIAIIATAVAVVAVLVVRYGARAYFEERARFWLRILNAGVEGKQEHGESVQTKSDKGETYN